MAVTSRLFFHAPRDVVTLFRAVLCTVRRAIERQTGTMPTAGQAFDAMLEHATNARMPPSVVPIKPRVDETRRRFAAPSAQRVPVDVATVGREAAANRG
jgi:hypothetical protein